MRDIPFRRRGLTINNDTFFADDRPGARPAIAPAVGAGASPGIFFPSFSEPSSDFQATRDGRRTLPLWFLVDLSTARSIAAGTAALLQIQGNTLYADPLQDSSGNNIAGYATVHFQDAGLNPQGTPLTVGPQFIGKVPFTQVLVENIAQAGKFLRIVYGVDIDFSPGLNASVTLSGIAQFYNPGQPYGAAFASITALAGSTNEVQLAPASNTAGVILHRSQQYAHQNLAIGSPAAMLCKSAAPASLIDGDVVNQAEFNAAVGAFFVQSGKQDQPLLISTGKGIYYRSGSQNEGYAQRSVLYTIK